MNLHFDRSGPFLWHIFKCDMKEIKKEQMIAEQSEICKCILFKFYAAAGSATHPELHGSCV